MKNNNIILITCFVLLLLCLSSCKQAGGESPGSEYMPDMAHSVAYEANYYAYYYNNRWGGEDEYYKMAQPRLPVTGTVPRGLLGVANNPDMMNNITGQSSINAIAHAPAGSVPYYYGNTEEERTRAMNEIISNPYPITDSGLARAENLYNIYCGICHGEKGDGAGYLVRDPDPAKGDVGGLYPVQPANLLQDEFITATNGRYYHAIMHGKNLMGAYKDKLSYEERWQVIHYIRSLQAKEKKLAYSQMENTLNSVDKPAGEIVVHVEKSHDSHEADHGHIQGHDDGHGQDADHDHKEGHDENHGHDEDHDH